MQAFSNSTYGVPSGSNKAALRKVWSEKYFVWLGSGKRFNMIKGTMEGKTFDTICVSTT